MAEIIPFPIAKARKTKALDVPLSAFLAAVRDRDTSPANVAAHARHHATLTALRRCSVAALRQMWDQIGDDSFYHGPEGDFDCADIHRVLNEKGDGRYCAV